MELSRRRFLMSTLFGGGLIGLRSLATGIPISILANPRRALAGGTPPAGAGQYIIFQTSSNGDPLNANVPGMYVGDLATKIAHPMGLETGSITLGGQSYTAAAPWAMLPMQLLDRMCFFHHATYTVVHADEAQTLALDNYTADGQMFVSMLASQLAPMLGTIQPQPVVLGPRPASEDLFYQGAPQPIISPSALSLLLAPPSGPLGELTALRDRDLNRLNAFMKCNATPSQASFLDQYVLSQRQVREISHNLLSLLNDITDDSPDSQVSAAIALIQMKVAPVVSINIPFGGDNHVDGGLSVETQQTQSGCQTIGNMWSKLKTAGLQDQVSFLSLNVFGRTLTGMGGQNKDGRQHNANHHVAVMFGRGFRFSVIGGVELLDADAGATESDYGAMSIDSKTGQGVPNSGGDIQLDQSLQAMALTFGAGVGIDPTYLTNAITGGGAIIQPALSG